MRVLGEKTGKTLGVNLRNLNGEKGMIRGDESEDQLEEITTSMVEMARLNFSHPLEVRGEGPLDAVAMGLRALGEELQATIAARDEAQRANAGKVAFLLDMSHELRTPLMTVLSCVDLLGTTELTPEQAKWLESIHLSGTLLTRLIRDVLDFARIETGSLQFDVAPLQLRRCFERVFDAFRERASKKGIVLEWCFDSSVDVWVEGDEHRIEQVLNNLLDNAVKYTRSGGVRIEVSGQEDSREVNYHIRVQDTGPGIEKEDREIVFERHVQLEVVDRVQKPGAGLGLSIVRALTEAMGGRVRVLESELGTGTTFEIFLACPRGLPDETVVPFRAVKSKEYILPILVVDDTEMVRDVTVDMLEALGFAAQKVASGEEAIALFATHQFSLVLMDLEMPTMSGLKTLARLRELYPTGLPPVAAMTAHTCSEDMETSLEAGMQAHLNKPFGLEELEHFVTALLTNNEEDGEPLHEDK